MFTDAVEQALVAFPPDADECDGIGIGIGSERAFGKIFQNELIKTGFVADAVDRSGNRTVSGTADFHGLAVEKQPEIHFNLRIGLTFVVTVAAGNPCRVIRSITDADRRFLFRKEEIDSEAWQDICRMNNWEEK